MITFDGTQFVNSPTPEGVAPVTAIVVAIDDYAAFLRTKACSPASPFEAASWSLKIAEAKAGGGQMLATEAKARGVPLEALVARVLTNSGNLAMLEATIAGVAGKHKDAARASDDPVNYDWRGGWPDLAALIR